MNSNQTLDPSLLDNEYKYGFVTDIESERPKKGVIEDTIKFVERIYNW